MTKENLELSTEYAKALMTKEEVISILELTDEEAGSIEFEKAYLKGFLLAKYLVQKSTVELAQSGSSPAQTISNQLIKNIEEKEVLNG